MEQGQGGNEPLDSSDAYHICSAASRQATRRASSQMDMIHTRRLLVNRFSHSCLQQRGEAEGRGQITEATRATDNCMNWLTDRRGSLSLLEVGAAEGTTFSLSPDRQVSATARRSIQGRASSSPLPAASQTPELAFRLQGMG